MAKMTAPSDDAGATAATATPARELTVEPIDEERDPFDQLVADVQRIADALDVIAAVLVVDSGYTPGTFRNVKGNRQ